MVTTTAGEAVVTGEVAARPAVASMVMANEATAMADEVRAVGTAAAALATVPVSIVAARQRWQGRQWRRWRRCWRWRERRWRWWRRQGHVGWRRWAWRWWYGGGYDVAAYSRALLAVKRELRNGAELSGMRVIVRSFLQFCHVQATFFFARPPTKGSSHLERLRRRKCAVRDQRGVFHDDWSDWSGHLRSRSCAQFKLSGARAASATSSTQCAQLKQRQGKRGARCGETLVGSGREAISEPRRQVSVAPPPERRLISSSPTR